MHCERWVESRSHRTDRFTAAVTSLTDRAIFTNRYQGLINHYGLKAEKIQARKPNENGDVEQSHYRFIRALDQALALRGSRDFDSITEYRQFVQKLCEKRNSGRRSRFSEELPLLRPLPARRLADYKRLSVRVSKTSTIVIDRNIYSVHSRLIGERLNVRLYASLPLGGALPLLFKPFLINCNRLAFELLFGQTQWVILTVVDGNF